MSKNENIDSEGRLWRISEWFPDLSTHTVTALRAFHSELIYFNGRMNLISSRTERIADSIHFADAILGSRAIFSAAAGVTEIYDIGSGNGIPGIVFSLLYQNVKVVLVDADARKTEFMKHCAARLSLSNCHTKHARLEDLGEASVHCAMSRGFSSISKTLVWSRKCMAPGGQYFHFKGKSWSTELAEIPSQVLAHWDPQHLCNYNLPGENIEMSIILTKRI